ncbi:MAG TPA: NUDIX domain-containing protein [Phycicoccus sp.]|nr:NUDIX domain-containing protein [Phycicoccus sp.]
MIEVVATDAAGAVVAAFPLAHGADPGLELGRLGWVPLSVSASGRAPRVTLSYAVEPGPVRHTSQPQTGRGERRQRLAAYAVVVADDGDDGVLLTELSDKVSGGAGLWLLPGGGVDPGEEPTAAIVREVWEETGQVVDRVELVDVLTSHRPDSLEQDGRLVDFHAIRLVHVARCPDPTVPVVHDVGGSTASAAWVPVAEVLRADRHGRLPSGQVLATWVHQLFAEVPELLRSGGGEGQRHRGR